MLDELHRPVCIDGQRASALHFGDPRVQALFAALLRFDLLPYGFRNRELREAVASLSGLSLDDYGTGRMTYDLRRLRLRGLIERVPGTRRYQLTAEEGLRRAGVSPHAGARPRAGAVGDPRRGLDHTDSGGRRPLPSRGRPGSAQTGPGRVSIWYLGKQDHRRNTDPKNLTQS